MLSISALQDMKPISADSHIVEPPDMYTGRIEPRFRDRAPHLVSRDDGDFLVCEGALLVEHGIGLMATKRKYEHPENYDFDFRGRWDDVVKAAYVRQLRIYGYLVKENLGWWPKRGLPRRSRVALCRPLRQRPVDRRARRRAQCAGGQPGRIDRCTFEILVASK